MEKAISEQYIWNNHRACFNASHHTSTPIHLMILLYLLYGCLVLIATLNLLMMRRPSGVAEVCFEVMIPARDEEHNLRLVLPPLISGGAKVTVFNDESTDRTGELAGELGADVIAPSQALPKGWTGKNRACHELSRASTHEWVVFLDADTLPSDNFVAALSHFLASRPDRVRVVSGFPQMLPGQGIEPAYLGWVPWILLAANPFGLVAVTGKGHVRFTNGQITAWRRETLLDAKPFESLKGEILEDVKIGRMLAKRKEHVEIANLSGILKVRMYWTLAEAIDGMSKNSADIGGSVIGSTCFAFLLFFIAWGWLIGGRAAFPLLGLLILSKVLTDRIVRAPFWTFPFLPLTVTAAAMTVFRSLLWKQRGAVKWKGRTYDHR